MLKFAVYHNGASARDFQLRNAYLIGPDVNPIQGSIEVEDDKIVCEKREPGPAALCLQHPAAELGELSLQTCLLPDREEPYILSLELARHRLMVLYTKLEDWAMFELEESHPVSRRTEKSRKLFIEALCHQRCEPVKAASLAEESLVASLDGSEELALTHSELLLNRRKAARAIPRTPVGCGVGLTQQDQRLRSSLAASVDYVQIPLPWKVLSPEENAYHWEQMDRWAEWAVKTHKPIVAGPVVSFDPSDLPDWLYIWEHDYDTVRDLIYEHIERVVDRYNGVVAAWNIVSGLHVNSHFTFNFEQLMDLTRMSTMLVNKLHPQSTTIVEIRQPFGEYYASNARSIPPMMYIDLLIQSGIHFDSFGVRLPMGQAVQGQYTRDLMQISSMFDQFAGLGKPLFVTVAAPSDPVTHLMIAHATRDEPVDDNCGFWRRPWSAVVQGHWLEAVFQIAMSKPYIEAVAWQDLVDHQHIELPLAGLVSDAFQPKSAFKRLVHFRQSLQEMQEASDSTAPGAPGLPGSGDSAAWETSADAQAPDPDQRVDPG